MPLCFKPLIFKFCQYFESALMNTFPHHYHRNSVCLIQCWSPMRTTSDRQETLKAYLLSEQIFVGMNESTYLHPCHATYLCSSTFKTSPLSQTAFLLSSLLLNLIWPQLLAWLLPCSPYLPDSPQSKLGLSQKSDCVSLHKLIFILQFQLCAFKAQTQ